MQIPIINGIYTNAGLDLKTAYPVNLVPVPKIQGVSNGYLRQGDGIVPFGVGPGIDRGGINWNGICYRVMGSKLVRVESSGAITTLGEVGGPVNTPVAMDYSFDRLAIMSGGRLYYWNGALTQVTDPDLGLVLGLAWIDGYFMTTDGNSLIVTELNNPLAINPLKYGSSEVDPDPIVTLIKLRSEVYALNRYTIEVFDNVGGDFFPFQRIPGAQITKGPIGAQSCCVYLDALAFAGSGRNEAIGIYLGANSETSKISTSDVDDLLLTYTEAQLMTIKLEARNDKNLQQLYVHLPDRTLVYDAAASAEVGSQVWFILTSAKVGFEQYRARNLVWAYGKWLVGDPKSNAIGRLDQSIGLHWDQFVRWEFSTTMLYNDGKGLIFHSLELVSLTGRIPIGVGARISTSYSLDGAFWGQDHSISTGATGDRSKRLVWFQQGLMRNWRIQRFRGTSEANLSFLRLEAQVEPLGY